MKKMKRITLLMTAVIFSLVSCKKHETQNTAEASADLTALEKLTTGNQRFLEERTLHPHQNKQTVLDNQNGQKPFAVVVTCSDSRVSPEIVFDQGLGDLFVIRNAGN